MPNSGLMQTILYATASSVTIQSWHYSPVPHHNITQWFIHNHAIDIYIANIHTSHYVFTPRHTVLYHILQHHILSLTQTTVYIIPLSTLQQASYIQIKAEAVRHLMHLQLVYILRYTHGHSQHIQLHMALAGGTQGVNLLTNIFCVIMPGNFRLFSPGRSDNEGHCL